ncbi:MAG: GNAT family N-acetyltransferase [Xenococcaceae cyanobacterium]
MGDKNIIIAETPRVIIRYFCVEDIPEITPIFTNPEVMKYSLSGVLTNAQTKNFINKMLTRYATEGYGYYAVIYRENKQIIDYCGLLSCSIEGEKQVEIGYRLAPNYWGKGLATEAAKAVRDYAFKKFNLDCLICLIQPENMASIKVAEKIGMKFARAYNFMEMPVIIYRIFRPN